MDADGAGPPVCLASLVVGICPAVDERSSANIMMDDGELF